MARADFYILKGTRNSQRFVCSITSKAWSQGNTVYILVNDRESAGMIDDLLWTYHDISFLPHSRIDETQIDSPVKIGWSGAENAEADVVINLTGTVPDFVESYSRVIEIITDDPDQKNKGRLRYKKYRDMGFEMLNHNIDSVSNG